MDEQTPQFRTEAEEIAYYFKKYIGKIFLWTIVFVLIILLINSIKFIGAGQSAIAFNKFSGKIDKILYPGVSVVNPITHKVKKYDIRTTKTGYEMIGLSSDSQSIKLNLVVNWKLDSRRLPQIYQTIQGDIEDTLLYNATVDTAKAELGKFQIDTIAKNRESLKMAVEVALRERMSTKYVIIENVSVTDVDFSNAYEESIQNKMIAEQRALEAKNNKDAAKFNSEAKAIENENLRKTLTPMVLQAKMIEKWDGKFPNTMVGSSSPANLLLNINQ